jgi:hypothetical protein
MVNVYNRYTSMRRIWRPILIGGIAPAAPINHLAMLHDYIGPRQRYITCPSQDLIYGFGILDLGREPVVVQVPDFGERFWAYQATDLRIDAFAELGTMYGTKAGFYLLAGPGWRGTQPAGIAATFRAPTNIGTIIPRVFQEDTRADNEALQPLIQEISPSSTVRSNGGPGRPSPRSHGSSSAIRNGNGSNLSASSMCCRRCSTRARRFKARKRFMRSFARCLRRPRPIAACTRCWPRPPLMQMPHWSPRYFNSAISASRSRITGPRS